jgi:hypothetical protein
MTEEEQEERILLALERIACAFEGLRDEAKRAGVFYWPQKQVQKESIVSRVETDGERELKMQGARRRTIDEIVDPNVEESEDEYVGERTRQWLKDHPQEKKAPTPSGEELL